MENMEKKLQKNIWKKKLNDLVNATRHTLVILNFETKLRQAPSNYGCSNVAKLDIINSNSIIAHMQPQMNQ